MSEEQSKSHRFDPLYLEIASRMSRSPARSILHPFASIGRRYERTPAYAIARAGAKYGLTIAFALVSVFFALIVCQRFYEQVASSASHASQPILRLGRSSPKSIHLHRVG